MSTYTDNGQYVLKRASLTFTDPSTDMENELDFSQAFVQIDLYESIFDHTMSGQITILDSYNLQDVLPLYGNEKFNLDFHTSGNSKNPIVYTGEVYKISEKIRISEHNSGYIIYFISEEATNSQKINVQRAFRDNNHKIVERIYARIRGGNEKLIEVEPTKSINKYVFGAVKPLQTITKLSSDSYNESHGYVFYEDSQKFNFKSLGLLYQQEPKVEYFYKISGAFDDVKQKAVESFRSIQDVQNMEENSYLDRLMEGQHGLTANRFDLLSKDYESFNYKKSDFYNSERSLGSIPEKKSVPNSNESLVSIRYENDPSLLLSGITVSRMSKIEINTIRANIVVFGDSAIRVGEVCKATLPNWNVEQKDLKNSIDGRFLICDIHHTISSTEYTQTMMIQKEAYEKV